MLHIIRIPFSGRQLVFLWGSFIEILWLLASFSAQAQSACTLHIKGQVTHADGEALPGAIVYVSQLRRGTIADENGNFHLENLCSGTYTLICQYVGHQADTTRLVVTQSVGSHHILLQELSQTLETVTIHGNTEAPLHSQLQSTLQGADLKRVEGASLGQMLKSLPGLTTLQTGPSISKPVIHGLHSNRVLILNNGIRQEGQQWGSEHAPEIDPFIARKVTVLKGASSVRYGADAIGGVILVEPDPLPYASALSGEVNVLGHSNNRQLTTSALAQGSWPSLHGLAWRVQATYKKAGTTQTPDYYLTNTQFEEKNASVSVGYHTERWAVEGFYSRFGTQIGIFQEAHIGNTTDLEKKLQNPGPPGISQFSYAIGRPYQDIVHQLLKIHSHYHTPTLGKFSLTYGYQQNARKEYDFTLNNDPKPSTDFQLYTHTYELLWEHKPLRKNLTGTIGISTLYQGNAIDGKRIFLPNFNNLGIGVFAIEHWVHKNWEFEGGVRYDYRLLNVYRRKRGNNSNVLSPSYTYQNVSGTIGAVYYPHNSLSLRLNLGSAWRPPTAAELYNDGIHHGAATYEKGDSTLTTETSHQATASLQWNPYPALQLEVGGYVNNMQGYIYLQPDSLPKLTIAGAFPAYTYTQVHTFFKGVDATIRYQFLPVLYWQGKMALVRARNLTIQDFQNFIPADRFENLLRFEKKTLHKLHDIYLETQITSVLRQQRTPSIYTRNQEIAGVPRTLYINDYMLPPNGYTLVQAEAGCTFLFGKSALAVSLAVHNLTNTRYREYLNRFRYFSDEAGRDVVLRLKWRF